jgi:hypothetical protein
MSHKWKGMGLFFPDEAHFLPMSHNRHEKDNEISIFTWVETPVTEKKERKTAYDFWMDKPRRYMPVYWPWYHIRIEEEKMFSKYTFKGPICLIDKMKEKIPVQHPSCLNCRKFD